MMTKVEELLKGRNKGERVEIPPNEYGELVKMPCTRRILTNLKNKNQISVRHGSHGGNTVISIMENINF